MLDNPDGRLTPTLKAREKPIRVIGLFEPDKMTQGEKLRWARDYLEPRNTGSVEKYRDMLVKEYGQRGKTITHAEAYELAEHGADLPPEARDILLGL
jgi:HD superfamily phosphohydrolase YqeK